MKRSTPSSESTSSPFSSPVSARVGVVGVGGMGASHARQILEGQVPGLSLAAVADPNADRRAAFAEVPGFPDWRDMLRSGGLDAVVVATPHFSHTEIGIAVLDAGLHLLMEKPLAVHKADAEQLLRHPRRSGQLFAAMLNQRGDPAYQAVRSLLVRGELGRLQRAHWAMTTWFRTDAYYASAPWRGTWAGEGGGLLINQACHNLDLYQWLFGLPSRVSGHCGFGRYHAIETEDDVTAWFEHADGMTGVFTSSTGEAPGSNRLEIVGDAGRIVLDDWILTIERNESLASETRRTGREPDSRPASRRASLPLPEGRGGRQLGVLQNFGRALRQEAELMAPAEEALAAVELSNAILYSAWTERIVELPLAGGDYVRELQRRIDRSPRTAPLAAAGVPIPQLAPRALPAP